jgi:hypothetical protein
MRRLRHPLRLVTRLATIVWLWRNRHDLARWIRFLIRLPSEAKTRELGDLFSEAQARLAISLDPRLRLTADLDIDRFHDGTVVVRTHRSKPVAQVAAEVLDRVPGVHSVEVVDVSQPVEPEPGGLPPAEAIPAGTTAG